MKANELRIGNLVNVYGIPKLVDANYILGLYQIEIAEKICIDLTPIPLTEDWLVKFGFKNILEPKYFELETDSFLITFDNGIIYICVGTYVEEGSKFPHIQYVHQLQNLYHALTGTELTIK